MSETVLVRAARRRPCDCGAHRFESRKSTLAGFAPAALLVCTPPVLHIEPARQAVAGASVAA